MVRVTFPGIHDDNEWSLLVADRSAPAWEQFADVMRAFDYAFRDLSGGTYNCRRIKNKRRFPPWSLHAYGVAIDLNPTVNRFGRRGHDYPPGFLHAVSQITYEGKQAFRWGGTWRTPDPMHFQINLRPSRIPEQEDNDLSAFIESEQKNLNKTGFTDLNGKKLKVDGEAGPKTESAMLKRDQAAARMGGDTVEFGDTVELHKP